MIKKILTYLRKLLPNTRKSNPLSKLLRPFFEKNRFKTYLGIQLAGFAAIYGVLSYPAQAFDYSVTDGQYIDGGQTIEITTESKFQLPLTELSGISQGFYRFHTGVDMRAPMKTSVLPVMAGDVVEVGYLSYGYGNYVLIAHEGGFVSLYAHLGEVFVNSGSSVSRNTIIGEVGLTGWTTGSHLHFELLQDGVYVNPLAVVDIPNGE